MARSPAIDPHVNAVHCCCQSPAEQCSQRGPRVLGSVHPLGEAQRNATGLLRTMRYGLFNMLSRTTNILTDSRKYQRFP